MKQVFAGKHWISGRRVVVTVSNGKIDAVTEVDAEERSDLWIAPGLIDIQLNGIGGFNLNTMELTVDTVIRIVQIIHQGGVTRFCPTVVTGTKERMLHCIRTIAEACDADPLVRRAILGIHVEGPFISDVEGPRGAHNKAWVRDPDEAEFMDWMSAAKGNIAILTLAPEKPGALGLIRLARQEGVVVSIGHCNATDEEIRLAVEAGATASTHLGNGAHPYIKRHPNYIWAQLAEERLWAGLIPDGHHLPATTLKVMIHAKGPRAILTSDAVHIAGLPPGRYRLNQTDVILEANGCLHLAENPDMLAGSATPLHRGLQFVAISGISTLGEAIQMASLHPAQMFRLDGQGVGKLESGSPADFFLYQWGEDQTLRIVRTISNGSIVYEA